MEDHLLVVQFILIQSGGRAEQRVNAAHIHILSTPWGRTHRHTLHAYKHAHNTLLRKHTLSFVTGPQAGPCIFLHQCAIHNPISDFVQPIRIKLMDRLRRVVYLCRSCGAHWLPWPERQFQSPIKSTRRLRWVMCISLSKDIEHIP